MDKEADSNGDFGLLGSPVPAKSRKPLTAGASVHVPQKWSGLRLNKWKLPMFFPLSSNEP